MLIRLSMATARLLDVHFQPSDMSIPEDETLVVDIEPLRTFVFPLPHVAWHQVADMCGRTIAPMYKTIQKTLSEDMEHVVKVLSEINDYDDDQRLRPVGTESGHHSADMRLDDISPDVRPHRKRRRSSTFKPDHPLIIRSTHPSTPTIIITPCPPQPRELSCRVPYQDSAFRNKLTVPAHPIFNDVFPPMVHPSYALPVLEKWRWQDGHWQAFLPGLNEQAKKGMFSRALTVKKKIYRTPGRPAACGGLGQDP